MDYEENNQWIFILITFLFYFIIIDIVLINMIVNNKKLKNTLIVLLVLSLIGLSVIISMFKIDYEEINNLLINLTIFTSFSIIFMAFCIIITDNIIYKKNLIISSAYLLFLLFILLMLSILLNNELINSDNNLLLNDFVFSTKIINNDNILMTYPNRSILNLYYDYGIYRVKENIDINYKNLTNNYSFKYDNKIIDSQQIFNLTKELYNEYTSDNQNLIDKFNLNYVYYNKSYLFNIDNIIYVIIEYENDKYCLFKQSKKLVLNENNNTTNEVIYYKPLCILYNSFIHGYYRLYDFENKEVLCKLNTIGPDYIYDVNINKYYTIYGKYSNYVDMLLPNKQELLQNKMMKIKNYLSMILPLSFSTKLKITNYNNNFK